MRYEKTSKIKSRHHFAPPTLTTKILNEHGVPQKFIIKALRLWR